MSGRDVIDIRTRRPLDSSEHRRALVRELAELDSEIEPKHRRAEEIRLALGIIATPKGLEG